MQVTRNLPNPRLKTIQRHAFATLPFHTIRASSSQRPLPFIHSIFDRFALAISDHAFELKLKRKDIPGGILYFFFVTSNTMKFPQKTWRLDELKPYSQQVTDQFQTMLRESYVSECGTFKGFIPKEKPIFLHTHPFAMGRSDHDQEGILLDGFVVTVQVTAGQIFEGNALLVQAQHFFQREIKPRLFF